MPIKKIELSMPANDNERQKHYISIMQTKIDAALLEHDFWKSPHCYLRLDATLTEESVVRIINNYEVAGWDVTVTPGRMIWFK